MSKLFDDSFKKPRNTPRLWDADFDEEVSRRVNVSRQKYGGSLALGNGASAKGLA